MKVLFIMTDIFYAGAEYQIRNIIELCLPQKDIDVHIACENRTQNSNDEEVYNYVKHHGIKNNNIYDLNLGDKNGVVISTIKLVLKIIPHLIKNKFDIIFVYDQYGLIAIPILDFFSKNIVYSERNAGDTTVKRSIYRFSLKCCNLITCNSTVAKKYIENAMGVHVEQINNLVTMPDMIYHKELKKDNITVVVPCRIARIKNQMLVLKALMRDDNIRYYNIIVAGKIDDKEYEERLKDYVKTQKTSFCNVNIIGYVSDKEELYRMADIVILPSLSEGTPNVVLESFARKIPVFASSIPQSSELYKTDDFLFSPDNPNELIEKINKFILKDEEDIQRLLDENYKFVKENYSIKNGPQKYVDLFRKLTR